MLDVATGESTPIAGETPARATGPVFTPDGSSLMYTAGPIESPEQWTVPVAGGKSTVVIGGPGTGGELSPDGSLVTFLDSGFQPGGEHCGPCRFVANADCTDRRVIPGWLSNGSGTWSPDGRRIVTSDYGGKDILVVDVASGDASRVAKGNGALWLDGHTLLVEVA